VDRAEQRDLVRRGYDAVSQAYRDNAGQPNPQLAAGGEDPSRYSAWIAELAELVEPSAKVLDLGCGNGLPATRLLVEAGFQVVGLDFSRVQIERARQLVPGANFVHADMTSWDCEPESFDAVVSFYALIHVPLGDQREILPRIRRWLRPGGYLLAIVGHQRWTGVEDYLGAPMFWDHADRDTYLDWLREAGLNPLWNRFVPEGSAGHTLILARAEP
jgi:SAM-dependent methyltransferase